MNTQKSTYNLDTDRRYTEKYLVAYALKFPNLIQKIPFDKFKNEPLKIIASQIKSIKKTDQDVNLEVLSTYAIPRLTSKSFTEENCSSALRELFNLSETLERESDCNTILNHLQSLEAKDNVLNIATALTERVHSGEEVKVICNIGNQLTELGSRIKGSQKSVTIGDAFERLYNNIIESRAKKADIGVPYPMSTMAKALGTMYPSDLVVVAARPAVGKTALALNIARFTDAPCGIISSEMSAEQLSMRFVAMDASIPANRIRDAKNLTDAEVEVISECWTKHKGRKLYIEDKGSINIAEIEEQAEIWVNLHGIKVLIVDYAQRINSDRSHNSESEKIGHVTKRLKELAKRLGICVMLLAQINRDSVKGDRRPQTHDIKGCGDIEQEADTIILMHKPAMGTSAANEQCIVEMIIDKNRHGPVGILITEYVAQRVTFQDPSKDVLDRYMAA